MTTPARCGGRRENGGASAILRVMAVHPQPQGPARRAPLPPGRGGHPGDHVVDRPCPGRGKPQTRDYWDFRDLITVHPRRPKSFDGYLQLFHWTELIQSSPIAVERAVYEVIGGAYRKNNITTTELRFNPMKRNRGGEQDLDHIIAAAVRGMDRATLEYPVKPGLIFCLDRAFPYELNEIIAEKAIGGATGASWASTSRARSPRRSAWRTTAGCSAAPASTAWESRSTPGGGPVDEVARVVELLETDRIGHGVKAAYDPRAMAMIRERGIMLKICPTSNLNTGVVSSWDEFRWISTSPPPRRPLRDQHRRPRDAQDLHPRRARHARSPGHPHPRGAAPESRPRRSRRRSCQRVRGARDRAAEPARREAVEREEA